MSKLKEFFSHPLMAPLVDPVVSIVKFGMQPAVYYLDDFSSNLKASLKEDRTIVQSLGYAWGQFVSRQEKMVRENGQYDGDFGSAFSFVAFGFFGGVGAAITGGVLAGQAVAASTGTAAGIGAGIAVAPIAGFAGPFILLGGVCAVALTIGAALKGTPHFLQGLYKAGCFIANPKKYAAAQQQAAANNNVPPAIPQQPAATTTQQASATSDDVCASFGSLSSTERQAALDALKEKFPTDFSRAQERDIAQAVEKGIPKKTESAPIPNIKKKPFNPSAPHVNS